MAFALLKDLITLTEGGNAFDNVRRIKKDEIPKTLSFLAKELGMPLEDFHLLGTTGKKADSGDIDLAVDSTVYDKDVIDNKLSKYDNFINSGFNINSYAIPIEGNPDNGYAQVDLFYTDKPDWAKFSYFASADSKYKGAVRNALLTSLATLLNTKGLDFFETNDDGELITRVGRTLDVNKGLRRIAQIRPTNVKTGKYLKSLKTIPITDLKQHRPDVDIPTDDIIINDPEQVLEILFGKKLKRSDVDSAEQIIELIKTSFPEKVQDVVFDRARKRIEQFKLPIPDEIQ